MMMKLLVAYEGTNAGRHVLEYLAPFVQDAAADLTLLTVAPNPQAQAQLYDEAVKILGIAPAVHLSASGPLRTSLLHFAAELRPDLVVFGELGRGWGTWGRLRRLQPLSAVLPVSSLLVRGRALGITKALICAGGDETIITNAQLIAQLVPPTGAKATILHVLSQMPLTFGRGTGPDRIAEAFAATGAPEMKHMQTAVDALATAAIDASIKIRIGLVIEEIVAELTDGAYDLLVVGSHRSQGLVERLLLEDVTAGILGHSPVSVLVVKPR